MTSVKPGKIQRVGKDDCFLHHMGGFQFASVVHGLYQRAFHRRINQEGTGLTVVRLGVTKWKLIPFLFLLFFLTGCITLRIETHINSDGSGEKYIIQAYDREQIHSFAPVEEGAPKAPSQSAEDFVPALIEETEKEIAGIPGASVEPYQDTSSGREGIRITLPFYSLDELTAISSADVFGNNDTVTYMQSGSQVTLHIAVNASELISGSEVAVPTPNPSERLQQQQQLEEMNVVIEYAVSVPGRITAYEPKEDARVESNRVIWDLTPALIEGSTLTIMLQYELSAVPEGAYLEPTTITFDDLSLPGWEYSPNAIVEDGKLQVKSGGYATAPGEWGNQEIKMLARWPGEGKLEFHYQESEAGSYLVIIESDKVTLVRESDGQFTEMDMTSFYFPVHQSVPIIVTVTNGEHQIKVNGQLILETYDPQPLPPGRITFKVSEGAGWEFDDLEITPLGGQPLAKEFPWVYIIGGLIFIGAGAFAIWYFWPDISTKFTFPPVSIREPGKVILRRKDLALDIILRLKWEPTDQQLHRHQWITWIGGVINEGPEPPKPVFPGHGQRLEFEFINQAVDNARDLLDLDLLELTADFLCNTIPENTNLYDPGYFYKKRSNADKVVANKRKFIHMTRNNSDVVKGWFIIEEPLKSGKHKFTLTACDTLGKSKTIALVFDVDADAPALKLSLRGGGITHEVERRPGGPIPDKGFVKTFFAERLELGYRIEDYPIEGQEKNAWLDDDSIQLNWPGKIHTYHTHMNRRSKSLYEGLVIIGKPYVDGEYSFALTAKDIFGNRNEVALFFKTCRAGFEWADKDGNVLEKAYISIEKDVPVYLQFVMPSNSESIEHLVGNSEMVQDIRNQFDAYSKQGGDIGVLSPNICFGEVPAQSILTTRDEVLKSTRKLIGSDLRPVVIGDRTVLRSREIIFELGEDTAKPKYGIGHKDPVIVPTQPERLAVAPWEGNFEIFKSRRDGDPSRGVAIRINAKDCKPARLQIIAGTVTLNALNGMIWRGDTEGLENHLRAIFTIQTKDFYKTVNAITLELRQGENKREEIKFEKEQSEEKDAHVYWLASSKTGKGKMYFNFISDSYGEDLIECKSEYTWRDGGTARQPVDISQQDFKACIRVSSRRGEFSSSIQNFPIHNSKPGDQDWPAIKAQTPFNPLLARDDGWADSMIRLGSSGSGDRFENQNWEITFYDPANAHGAKGISLQVPDSEVWYDVISLTVFPKFNWDRIYEFWNRSISKNELNDLEKEIKEKAPHLLNQPCDMPIARDITIVIEGKPKENEVSGITVFHRRKATITVEPEFKVELTHCRLVQSTKISSEHHMNDYYEGQNKVTRTVFNEDLTWIQDGAGKWVLDEESKSDVRDQNAWIQNPGPTLDGTTLVFKVKPNAVLEFDVDVRAAKKDGKSYPLGRNLPFKAFNESVLEERPFVDQLLFESPASALSNADTNARIDEVSKVSEAFQNNGASLTTYTRYRTYPEHHSAFILRCRQKTDFPGSKFQIVLGLEGQQPEKVILARVDMPYISIENVFHQAIVPKGSQVECGLQIKYQILVREYLAKASRKTEMEELANNIEWFSHGRLTPFQGEYESHRGGDPLSFYLRDEFLDYGARDWKAAGDKKTPLTYLTVRSANAKMVHFYVRDLWPNTCKDGDWVIRMSLKGASLTFFANLGYAHVSWEASCSCNPKLKVTGSGHFLRCGAGTTDVDAFLGEVYVGFITGAKTLDFLSGSYWGIFAQSTILGQGPAVVRVRQTLIGPNMTIWPEKFLSIENFIKWGGSAEIDYRTAPLQEKAILDLLKKNPEGIVANAYKKFEEFKDLPYFGKLVKLTALTFSGALIILNPVRVVEK